MSLRCTFCGGFPPVAWYQAPDFRVVVTRAEDVVGDGAYRACDSCRALIDADEREALVRREVAHRRPRTWDKSDNHVALLVVRTAHDAGFWQQRDRGR